MKTSIEKITPEGAKQMLMLNIGNRKLRKSHVAKLASSISRGDWLVTHQGIALAPDGRILDGQHRLAAIVAANVPASMMVARDCDPHTFVVLDQGAKRTYGDAISRRGTEVSVLRWAIGFSKDGNPDNNVKIVSVSEVAEGVDWFGPHIDRVMASCSVINKTRTSAPILFAVALRVAMGQAGEVLPIWRAFVLLDLPNINASVASLLKRLDSGTITPGKDPLLAILNAFRAFDPDRQAIPLGGIRNEDVIIAEIRAEITKILDRWTAPKAAA